MPRRIKGASGEQQKELSRLSKALGRRYVQPTSAAHASRMIKEMRRSLGG